MSIKIIRAPSDTPNIHPSNDYRALRYAFGYINGFIKGFGQEGFYSVENRSFTVLPGELVVDGVQVEIEPPGHTISIPESSPSAFYLVYAVVDLRSPSNPQARIDITYSLSTTPTVDEGDDLTSIPYGLKRVPLYRFYLSDGFPERIDRMLPVLPPFGREVLWEGRVLIGGTIPEGSDSSDTSGYTPIFTADHDLTSAVLEIEYEVDNLSSNPTSKLYATVKLLSPLERGLFHSISSAIVEGSYAFIYSGGGYVALKEDKRTLSGFATMIKQTVPSTSVPRNLAARIVITKVTQLYGEDR